MSFLIDVYREVIILTLFVKKSLWGLPAEEIILSAVRAITCESRDFSVLDSIRIVWISIQRFHTTNVTADRRDSTTYSAISEQFAIGHRRGGHRNHVEERQNSVHDRCRRRPLPRLEPSGSEALLWPRGSLCYPDSWLQYTVVCHTDAVCIQTHRIYYPLILLTTIRYVNTSGYLSVISWKYKS